MLHKGLVTPWYVDIINYLVTRTIPEELNHVQKAKIKSDAKYYVLDEPYLWKHYSEQVIRKYVCETEFTFIPIFYHTIAYEGHFQQKEQPLRYLRAVFISHHCLRMYISFVDHMIIVRE